MGRFDGRDEEIDEHNRKLNQEQNDEDKTDEDKMFDEIFEREKEVKKIDTSTWKKQPDNRNYRYTLDTPRTEHQFGLNIPQENRHSAHINDYLFHTPLDKIDVDKTATRKKGAKNGFMGMVNHKTMFTVGEQKKKEFVSVKPKSNDFDMFRTARKSKKKSNNIFDVGGF